MKNISRNTLVLLLCLVVLFSLVTTVAFADQPGDQAYEVGISAMSVAEDGTSADESEDELQYYPVESGWVVGYPSDRSENNEELLNSYAQMQLDRAIGSEVSAASTGYALEKLREEYPTMAKIYEAILPEIQAIAAGRRTSTKISGSLADLEGVQLTYTAAELGYSSITSANISAAQKKAMQLSGLLSADGTALIASVVDALLSDCAYELYWFDKTSGYSYGYDGSEYYPDSLTLVGGYHIDFSVSSEFAAGDRYTVSAAHANTIFQAIETAQGIVQAAAGRADWSRLNYYRQQICNLTEYNNDAADKTINTPYGNPWQLIWVFDGDPDTTVVCEGYAKAFAYLCELTNAQDGFQDVACYLVDGKMSGGTGSGGHMWNVVRTGGKNYLVDVTNCDDGTIGAPAQLFMTGFDSVDTTGVYQFTCAGGNIRYEYDSDSLNAYGAEKLSIVSKAEITAPTDGRTVTLTVNGNTETASARVNETVTMLVRAPGATGVRIWNPTEQDWVYYGSYAPLNYLEYRSRFAPGEWNLYAQACYNEYSGNVDDPGEGQWTTLSNEVTLTVPTSTVNCPSPNATLNGTIYTVRVKRGEWLHAAIVEPPAEGAWYQLKLWKKIDSYNNYQLMPDEEFSFNAANELYIPAEHFAPGDYVLAVRASAVGYNDSDDTNLFFTVTEETPIAGLKLSKNSSPCLQDVMASGYVPGAHHMSMDVTRAGDASWSEHQEWQEELFWQPVSYINPGEYTLTLTAYSENDTLLGTYTASVTMTAAENTSLQTPDLSSFPQVLRSGEEFSGTIGVDEQTDYLYIGITFYPNGGERQSIYQSERKPVDGESWTTVDLPAELFTQAGRYELFVQESAPGKNNANAFLSFFRQQDPEVISDGSTFNFTTGDEGIFQGQYSGSKVVTPEESGIYSFTLSFEGNPEIQLNQAYLGIIGTDIEDRTFDTRVPASMTISTTLTAGENYELVLSNLETLGALNVNVTVNYGIISYNNCLILPASTTEIGEEAFAGVAAQRIDLPEGIESIGSRAFADSDSLCFVIIPEAKVQIDSTAFQNSPYVRIAAPANGTVEEFANSAGITFLPLS